MALLILCNKLTSDADNTLLKLILYKISRSNVPAVGQLNRCGSQRLPNSPKYSTVKYSLSYDILTISPVVISFS